MNARWIGVALLTAVAVACGEGRAIFHVDVHSFMAGTGSDTLRLTPEPLPGFPPGSTFSDSITPVGVDLPSAMSSSIVEDVRLTGNLDITNPTSSGSLSYEVFFASSSDPAVVYAPGALALSIGAPSFPAVTTTSIPFSSGNLAALVGDAFKQSALYVGIRATIQNTEPVGGPDLKTTLKLTELRATIVFQDKVF
jgi:hypothetical protein